MFWKNLPLFLKLPSNFKKSGRFFQIDVVFSEYLNFIKWDQDPNGTRTLSSVFDNLFSMDPLNTGSSSSIQELVRAMTMEASIEPDDDSR